MTKASGLGDNLYVGTSNFSGDIGSLSNAHGGPATLDVTGIDKSAFERIGGLRDGGLGYTAFFNDSAGQAHARLKTLPSADVQMTYFRGTALGNAAASCVAKQINYDPQRAADGSLIFNIDAQANGFGLEWGIQLTAGVRTDTTASFPANGVDFTAASSFGAQFYLHVFAFTGTSVTIQVQDSADNVTFAPITGAGTFATVTAVGTQRLASANTVTVRRYLRVATAGTFTNVQFAVVAVKNDTAGIVF